MNCGYIVNISCTLNGFYDIDLFRSSKNEIYKKL